MTHSSGPAWTRRTDPAYRRISLALFLAGFATFSLLYCVQPLLPALADHFRVDAAQSSLALSLATGALAVAIVAAGALSRSVSRKPLMAASLVAAAVLNLLAALAPGWGALLVLRTAEGLALGGAPAVAMAYLAEEIDPADLGFAMGLYVAGTAFGGMTGRVVTGVVADLGSWREALGVIGLLGLASAAGFWALLPPSRNFRPEPPAGLPVHLRAWGASLCNSRLARLFAVAFLAMGGFVTLYNYAGFRLLAPPYHLSQTAAGLIFTVYLFGVAASAGAGWLGDRLGRAPVLAGGLAVLLAGVVLTLSPALPLIIAGIALATVGFFATHSTASSSVGGLAGPNKGHAASLYLLFYYLGSSLLGSAGGWAWMHAGWRGVVAGVAVLLAVALVLAVGFGRSLRRHANDPATPAEGAGA
jgi:YNFM family putative membrane transporter